MIYNLTTRQECISEPVQAFLITCSISNAKMLLTNVHLSSLLVCVFEVYSCAWKLNMNKIQHRIQLRPTLELQVEFSQNVLLCSKFTMCNHNYLVLYQTYMLSAFHYTLDFSSRLYFTLLNYTCAT